MNKLRIFQNLSSTELKLQILENSFSRSYEQSIRRCQKSPFVVVYKKDGSQLSRSFAEFDQDVKVTVQFLLENFDEYSILATRHGNTYEHLVYITAILTSGFQFCPLSPNDPIEKTNIKMGQLGDSCHLLDDLKVPSQKSNQVRVPKVRKPHEPFILVFTSGSTGQSKVVQQTEFGVLSNVEGLLKHHHLTEEPSTIATPLPLFHVNALEFSFFVSLLGGQKLILYETFDLMQVLKSFSEHRIHIFSAVPHLYFLLGQQIQKLIKSDLSQFRYFVSAAGPLPLVTFDLFAKNNLKIIQGYGLSEAVNFSLKTPVNFSIEKIKILAQKFERPPVGVPIWGNEVFALNENLEICREGEVGEICIRGVNVMLGYKQDQSSQVFNGDYLHTGDLGFWIETDESKEKIFFVTGRIKDIAKKFGSTVSLVELDESILSSLPEGVDAISVNFVNLRAGEEIGLVLRNPPVNFDLSIFFSKLKKNLSPEMLPFVFAFTSRPLRTESGKPLRWTFRETFQNFLTSQSGKPEFFVIDLRNEEHG